MTTAGSILVDRSKDLIISSGYNVYPRMIEEAVYEHPAVDECIVIGIPDPYRQEAPKVFVKLKPGAHLTFEELKKHLDGKIGKHEMPVALEIRPELPKNSRRQALQEGTEGRGARQGPGNSHRPPRRTGK